MWGQFKRMVESNLGRFREDPLGRRPDVGALAPHLATVRAQVGLLEQDAARLDREEQALGERIRQQLDAGSREQALRVAESLRRVREDRARVERQLEVARRACAKAESLQQTYGRGLPDDDPLLQAAAEETLSRLERELGTPSAPAAGGERGGDSLAGGPAEVVKTIGGGDAAVEDPGVPPAAAEVPKTIGPQAPPAPQQGTGSATVAAQPDLVTELERLAQLREQGLLDPEEFEQAKRRLLDR